MSDNVRLPLWAGRTAALAGIVLVAFTLRQAVAAMSPILGDIRTDIPISTLGAGLLGTLPPILLAISGFAAPRVARRLGLDGGIVLALLLMTLGHLVRASAPGFAALLGGSVIALTGTGLGNVLLPPVVRRWFPDRVALLTAVYVGVVGVSTAVPAALAAPVAERAGWRFSLGIWAVTALVALVPWTVVVVRERRLRRSDEVPTEPPALLRGLWRSRVAVSITVVFSTSTVLTYAAFAWLPEILGDVAGSTPTEAGVLLAVTGFVSTPIALVAPLLVTRLRRPAALIAAGVACFVLGYLGLLLAPAPLTLVWVLLIGSGSILFPVSLVLINDRTRTPGGTVALSGFAQGVAYGFGALGPLVVGLLHDVSHGWTLPLLFLLAVALVAAVPVFTLTRPVFVEDDLGRAGGRRLRSRRPPPGGRSSPSRCRDCRR
ncbi:MFS transporter [Kineosporia succinea]|uniref:CP family cyanate transporter-like MFS transporter n=1 Tax=Kineosporia succinea TaxID=84632 RepID=A0ABT9PAQ2_9ACTN|nr:MFS transporter [Kineosporia succinea]MDP9829776.1 CP family cyanate transporter-like MFS transporter [Kineosporia succinea]